MCLKFIYIPPVQTVGSFSCYLCEVGFDQEISDNVSFIKTVSSGISISMSVTCVNMSPLIDSIPFCFMKK